LSSFLHSDDKISTGGGELVIIILIFFSYSKQVSKVINGPVIDRSIRGEPVGSKDITIIDK
jgi:hypothetical protein